MRSGLGTCTLSVLFWTLFIFNSSDIGGAPLCRGRKRIGDLSKWVINVAKVKCDSRVEYVSYKTDKLVSACSY